MKQWHGSKLHKINYERTHSKSRKWCKEKRVSSFLLREGKGENRKITLLSKSRYGYHSMVMQNGKFTRKKKEDRLVSGQYDD